MTKQQVCITVGVAAAVLAFGYLATRREVNATVTAGEASLTYRVGNGGAAGAPTAQPRPSDTMRNAIDASREAIEDYVVPENPWGVS